MLAVGEIGPGCPGGGSGHLAGFRRADRARIRSAFRGSRPGRRPGLRCPSVALVQAPAARRPLERGAHGYRRPRSSRLPHGGMAPDQLIGQITRSGRRDGDLGAGQFGIIRSFPGGGRAVVAADLFALAVFQYRLGAGEDPFHGPWHRPWRGIRR